MDRVANADFRFGIEHGEPRKGLTLRVNEALSKLQKMVFTTEQLTSSFNKSSGLCHLCRKKLSRRNYGLFGRRGAWEVEHSRPQSLGGTHHGNNLYAACIPCNRKKSNFSTRTARGWNGFTRAPLSKTKRELAKRENATAGAAAGVIAGFAIAGPVGAFIGGFLGREFGAAINPDE